MTILVLTIGSVSIVGLSHVAMADQNGKQCIIFSCANVNITGGTPSSSGGGGGGGGQPTPNTGTLVVTKLMDCLPGTLCPLPSTFTIKVSASLPGTDFSRSFPGDGRGTELTLSPGTYTISETASIPGFTPSFSGDCTANAGGTTASVSIDVGDTKNCTIKNTG